MKKNFVKKLALAMALTLAVGSVPSMNVEAAAAPAFKSTKVNLKVGQTKKYNTVNSTKKSVKFVIGNKKIATVNYKQGNKYCHITGVAAGKTRVRAEFKDYKTKDVITKKLDVEVKEVVVEAELASVKQTAANAFEATFTADASKKFTAENFTNIESADGIFSAYVKSVEFTADGKTAKVTTFGNFVDKAVYNVTCGDKTASFTASVGAVANAVIDTVQAQANVATDVDFTLYDANGIDVTSAVDVNTYVTLSADGNYSDGNFDTVSDAKITLDTVGNTATVTLTYDPLTAEGQIVTTTGTIVCIPTQATVGKTTYFTMPDYSGTPKIYLNSFAEATTLFDEAVEETFYFTALDENGVAIDYEEYTVESSNENVITVSDGTNTSGKYVDFKVATVNAGTAKVIIKATKNEVETIYSGTVVVKAARKLTAIALDKSSITVSNAALHDNDKVKVTLKDQYGNSMSDVTEVTWASEQYNDTGLNVACSGNSGDKITVDARSAEKGSYVVEVKATDGDKTLTKKFSVKVNEPVSTATNNYKVELSTNSIDLNPETLYGDTEGEVVAKLALYKGTVFNGYVSAEKVYVTKGAKYFVSGDLTDVGTANYVPTESEVTSGSAISGSSIKLNTIKTNAEGAVDLKTGADGVVTAGIAGNGTYTVAMVITVDGKPVTKKATFNVKNTMEVPTVTIDATAGEGNLLPLVKDCVTVDVDKLASEDNSIKDIFGSKYATATLDRNGNTPISYVQVEDSFWGVTYNYYVPVSKTFKTK